MSRREYKNKANANDTDELSVKCRKCSVVFFLSVEEKGVRECGSFLWKRERFPSDSSNNLSLHKRCEPPAYLEAHWSTVNKIVRQCFGQP